MGDSRINGASSMDMRNIVLKSSLPDNKSLFNFCHLNPGSLVPNFDELKLIVNDIPFHAIAISETWLKCKHSSRHFDLDHFTLFRKDRAGRRSGGVGIYVKKFLKPRIIYANAKNSLFDIMFIEIKNQVNMKLALGVVYNPPKLESLKVEFIKDLETVLNDLMTRYSEVIIVGDFNINCLVSTPTVIELKSLMALFGLELISKVATNFMGDSATLIDLAFANQPNNFKTFTQISVPGIATTHDMIYGSYAFPIGNNDNNQSIYVRDFQNVDSDELLMAANSLNWARLYQLCDVNEQVLLLNSFISYLIYRFVPLKKISGNRKSRVPIFNNEILLHRNIRDFLHENWRKHKTQINRLKYVRARNKVNCMIKAAKCQFFNDRFSNNIPSKLFWKNYNTYINPTIAERKCDINPDEFNSYFGSVFTPNNGKFDPDSINFPADDKEFYFNNVSADEVRFHLGKIKSNSLGIDGIPLNLIQTLLPVLLPHLTFIINSGLTKSIFPDAWKVAIISPIPKIPNPSTVSDFRPISILPTLSKVFERIIHVQINSFIAKHNLLDEHQSGFRANHSTTTAMLKVTDDITFNIEGDKVGVLVLLDFSKAFDKVDHVMLLSKLRNEFNFSKSACLLINSYLNLRQQFVKYDDKLSDNIFVTSGVPQGSILGPILFSLYINQICRVIEQTGNISYHLFADDLQIYSYGDVVSVDAVIDNLNRALGNILDWSNAHKLQINPEKSQAILLTNKKRINPPNNFLSIDNHRITFCDKIRSLGLIIDTKLNWSAHVNNLCGKIYGILSKLWNTAKYITKDVKRHIIRTLVGPLLTYCSSIYSQCSKNSLKQLNVAFNSCARYIFLKRRGDPISHLSQQIFGVSLNRFLELSTLTVMFGLIKKKAPIYLYDKLQFSKSQRTFNLNLPRSCKTKPRRRSFFVHGVKLWNTLDPSIKTASNLRSFRRRYLDELVDT